MCIRDSLYCFSPMVMLVTFILELLMTLSILVRSRFKITHDTGLIVLILGLLASFQAVEYLVCADVKHTFLLAKIGFFSITLLPPLGIHLGYSLARQRRHPHILVPYMTAILLNAMFLLSPLTVKNVVCNGNYVIFELPFVLSMAYGFYYQGFLLYGLMSAFHLSHEVHTEKRAQRLRWLGFGYTVFMLPTAIVAFLRSETLYAIPSIMCGFAVILAFILYLKVYQPPKKT